MKNQLKSTALSLSLLTLMPGTGFSETHRDMLYTLSNNAGANEVLAFQLNENGTMEPMAQFATGGTGTGQGLGNQGALALSPNQHYLFATNAGSNDVSVFRVAGDQLELIDRAAETGITPVSVAAGHDWVYVVNAGDDSIFGYQFDPASGKLTPMPGSYRKLSGTGSGAAQISFDADQDDLVVTEKAVNQIMSFTLNKNGMPMNSHVIDSAGTTPFGFSFGKHNRIFVSEAQGGAANAATVSSYQLFEDGTLQVIDGALATGKTAACWLATTPNGKFAFTADTPANTIASFNVGQHGQLTLLNSNAAQESEPTDLAVGSGGTMLYTLSGGDNSIGVYSIDHTGSLQKKGSIGGIPTGATGLVVR